MIEISVWKIFLVLLVALIVLGPEQLPKVARGMGRLLGQLKNALGSMQNEIQKISLEPKEQSQKEVSERRED